MKKILVGVLVVFMVFGASSAFAGTKAGDKEVGVQFSFMNVSFDSSDVDLVIVAGKFGWFLSDAISLGVTGSGVSVGMDGEDTTQLAVEFEPNYHFNTAASVVPYAGIHTGLAIVEGDGYDSTELSYGPQGGIKSFLNENTALDTQLRYTFTDVDGTDVDIFELRVGLNIYF
jgi:hypothetical protein